MNARSGSPQRIGLVGTVLAILLLLGSVIGLLAGLVLAMGDPYHDKRFPEFLLLCLVFVIWGLGFGYVAIRMLLTRIAKPVSGKTVGIILVTPFFINFVLLATKGELLESFLGIFVLAVGCIFYLYRNRRGDRTD